MRGYGDRLAPGPWVRGSGPSWLAAVLLAFGAAACSSQRPLPGSPQVGVASWYGPGFHGKATTSGEIYDQNGLTAAHRTLPLGTRVRVTNLGNGRATEVRVNDRGPFVSGRHIDLSYAAARQIDMVQAGVCEVKIEPLLQPGSSLAEVRFAVQVASFSDEKRARAYRERLAAIAPAGETPPPPVYVASAESSSGAVYRVRLGPYPARVDAESSAARLARSGLAAVVVEENVSRR